MSSEKNIILHFYTSYKRFGGAQKVILTIFRNGFNLKTSSLLVSFHRYEKIDPKIKEFVPKNNYIHLKFRNLKILKNALIVSHDRKITFVLVILSFFFKIKIVHVAHSVYNNFKRISLFPENTIAVSNAVKENLVQDFGIESNKVTVIYNGIEDKGLIHTELLEYDSSKIKILHLGHIEENKRQLKIVEYFKDKMPEGVSIHFAGEGRDSHKLQETIQREGLEDKFKYLGFCNDVYKLIPQYDYVLLFSRREGLGLSIIEACMLGRPVITNAIDDTKACGEVCIHGYNGFIANSFEDLLQIFCRLKYIDYCEYERLCCNARKVYEEKFDLKIMLKSYYFYFANILNRNK